MRKQRVKLLYAGVGVVLVGVYLSFLANGIRSSLLENDLWWMIPAFSYHLEGKTAVEIASFLLGPWPIVLSQPLMKLGLFTMTSLWGWHMKPLMVTAAAFHLGNAILLFGLARQLGFARRVCLFSSLAYLTMFVHSHAVLWPVAFLHLLAVFTVLAVLNLYLKTESLLLKDSPWARVAFVFTLGMGLVASLQRSAALLAPALILFSILVSSPPEEKGRRYDFWLPLLLLGLLYPLASLTFLGDDKLTTSLARLPFPPAVRFFLSFLGCVAALGLLRLLLKGRTLFARGLLKGLLWFLPLAGMVGLLYRDSRQILFPYNLAVPFISTLASFLSPWKTALSIDSTEPYYWIPPQVSPFLLLLSLGVMASFLFVDLAAKRQRILLLAWYAIAAMYPFFHYTSFPVQIPSRYFIYLSPVFSILFCSALVSLYTVWIKRTRPQRFAREALLASLFMFLCLANLLALPLTLWRGRLTNNFYSYDYLQTAQLIKNDLSRKGETSPEPDRIRVFDVAPMPFGAPGWDFVPLGADRYRTFRHVLGEVFGNDSLEGIPIDVSAIEPNALPLGGPSRNLGYHQSQDRITDREGRALDPFTELFQEGVSEMLLGHDSEALALFSSAIRQRPFLLNYLLPRQCHLSDVRWLTNGLGLRQWLWKISDQWGQGTRETVRSQQIFRLMRRELSDYLACLFYLSYLKDAKGDSEGSSHWLSQIWFIEQDPQLLISWIGEEPLVRENPAFEKALRSLQDPSYFHNPLPWRKDDFGFGRFLVRFFLRWDIPSGWDRRMGLLI